MILFRPEFIEPILQGKKTQTRRWYFSPWQVGHKHDAHVAVGAQRSKTPFATLVITALRREKLGDISEADVKREGFDSVAAFYDFWWSIYGGLDADALVCVIDFEVVQRRCSGTGVSDSSGDCGD